MWIIPKPQYNCRTMCSSRSQQVWQVNTNDFLGEIAGKLRMLLLTFNEISESNPQYDSQFRGFVYPLALSNVVGPHQVVHSKCTQRRILNSLSQRKYKFNMHCTKCYRSNLWEIIIALYTGLKIRQIAGEIGGRHLFHRISGGHFHGCQCDEGREASILCPCNEGEGDDEQLNKTQPLPCHWTIFASKTRLRLNIG